MDCTILYLHFYIASRCAHQSEALSVEYNGLE